MQIFDFSIIGLGLMSKCPDTHEEANCPFAKLRSLPKKERAKRWKSMSKIQQQQYVSAHNRCLAVKMAKIFCDTEEVA